MKNIYRIIFLMLLCLFNSVVVYGDTTNGSFTISPIDPNTGEINSSYYDLIVKPSEDKELTVRIFNNSETQMKILVTANNGSTNNNGITSYLGMEERDSSLKVAFTDIVLVKEQEVSVNPQSYKDVSIHIKIPQKKFDGEILGGIRVTSLQREESNKSISNVTNNIAYTLGVVLRESNKEISPEMNLLDVIVEQKNSRNYISSKLQNKAPTIIKELKAEQKVFKKGENTVLYESSNSNMRMAPNSNFNFEINLDDHVLRAGNYTMKVSGTADDVPFSFEKDFTIEEKEAREFNRSSVYVNEHSDGSILNYVLLIMLGLLGLTSFYVIVKKRRY